MIQTSSLILELTLITHEADFSKWKKMLEFSLIIMALFIPEKHNINNSMY
jgi:hypothetical protein